MARANRASSRDLVPSPVPNQFQLDWPWSWEPRRTNRFRREAGGVAPLPRASTDRSSRPWQDASPSRMRVGTAPAVVPRRPPLPRHLDIAEPLTNGCQPGTTDLTASRVDARPSTLLSARPERATSRALVLAPRVGAVQRPNDFDCGDGIRLLSRKH